MRKGGRELFSLSAQQVKELADQARLGVTEEEIAVLTPAINQTLKYIEAMREAPVPAGEPTVNGGEGKVSEKVFRADQVCPSSPQAAVLRNGPRQFDGCFQTPLVLED